MVGWMEGEEEEGRRGDGGDKEEGGGGRGRGGEEVGSWAPLVFPGKPRMAAVSHHWVRWVFSIWHYHPRDLTAEQGP